MKKLALAVLVVLAITAGAWAQDAQPTQQQLLNWKKAELEREWAYCQQRLRYIKTEYDTIENQLKALQTPVEPTAPPAAPKPEAKKPKAPAQRSDQ